MGRAGALRCAQALYRAGTDSLGSMPVDSVGRNLPVPVYAPIARLG
jgi:hypothetical protein